MVRLFLIIAPALIADEGMIPLGRTDVSIYEPGQRAIVAWNGKKEVLILSTDVRASAPTKVLTILPLPGNPKISKGDFKTFERLERLIRDRSPYLAKKKNGGEEEEVKVLFHQKIGAHDITVAYTENYEKLSDWTKEFVKNQRIMDFHFPEEFSSTLKGYIIRGKRYFVFDVIEVGTENRTREPITYEFESSRFYYPLEISSTLKGVSEITLYCLTPLILDFVTIRPPLDLAYYLSEGGERLSPIVLELPRMVLEDMTKAGEIDSTIIALFSEDVYLTVLKYKGSLNFFDDFSWNHFLKPVELKGEE